MPHAPSRATPDTSLEITKELEPTLLAEYHVLLLAVHTASGVHFLLNSTYRHIPGAGSRPLRPSAPDTHARHRVYSTHRAL
eukprot:4591331-Prymnesium_polylepis.1